MHGFTETLELWKKTAKFLEKRSTTTWNKLKSGELRQEDATIYSVYEDQAKADTLNACIAEVEQILKGEK